MKSNYKAPHKGGLIENNESKDIITSNERVNTEIFDDHGMVVRFVADEVCNLINKNNSISKNTTLCLSSGASMDGVYVELTKRHRNADVSFKNVIIFALDEFYPFMDSGVRGEKRNLNRQLLDNIDIDHNNVFNFRDSIALDKTSEYCRDYEEKIAQIGGIDMVLMGIGTRGEIGYNDPGTAITSKTRLVAINQRRQKYFSTLFNNTNNTPRRAFTMGISTILDAKKVIVIALSEDKAAAIESSVEGLVSMDMPASFLQLHRNCTFALTDTAASMLTRIKTPWIVSDCNWEDKFIRKAVIWLCQKVNKPILKLTQEDYCNNSLSGLVETMGDYSQINIKIFNELQHTITGWPGGKPNADDTHRPERAMPFPKRVLIFSPHPDDDVISMGGTAIRLFDQGHNLHIAYQTSGNIAVTDDFVLQVADTARECSLGDIFQHTENIIKTKKSDCVEPAELRILKGSIRRAEAKAACRSFGMNDTNIHFLNLPFYETGAVKKGGLTQADIDIVKELIKNIAPHQIYAAGDLSDPHGTHRVCIESILVALDQLKGDKSIEQCRLWLYRGAWQEWDLDMVDMAVPLSPSEVIRKRHAIFRHASQKDIVPFPGDDSREFWQRAEERTSNTAKQYDRLGMAEYEAIEVFVEYPIAR